MELNESAQQTVEWALKKGGPEFLEFVKSVQSSEMAAFAFPAMGYLRGFMDEATLTQVSRAFDRCFLIGLYEAWMRLK